MFYKASQSLNDQHLSTSTARVMPLLKKAAQSTERHPDSPATQKMSRTTTDSACCISTNTIVQFQIQGHSRSIITDSLSPISKEIKVPNSSSQRHSKQSSHNWSRNRCRQRGAKKNACRPHKVQGNNGRESSGVCV